MRLVIIIICLCEILYVQSMHKLSKRFLIFPQSAPTRHQFIAGIGIPADLEEESLTVGYVLKAQYYLPYNETTFRQNPFVPEYRHSRSVEDLPQNGITRLDVYEAIENYIERLNYNGVDCLLRAICEAALIPIEEEFSVFGDIVRILLTPSLIAEESRGALKIYLLAEEFGLSGKSCEKEYYQCPISIMGQISVIMHANII